MEQSSNIDIPFRIKLEANQNGFKIPIPRYRIEDGYSFSFDHLTLIPELYSKQAQILDLDPEEENQIQITHNFQIQYQFDPSYYTPKPDAFKWTQTPATDKDIATTLASINNYFVKIKPEGSNYPPLTFDWCMRSVEGSGMSMDEFHALSANILYGENITDKQRNWMPLEARNKDINTLLFPTQLKDTTTLSSFRVRMHIAPNVKVGFSNDSLLKVFGFNENQYPPKTSPSAQIIISNPSASEFKTIWAEDDISALLPSAGNKISVYVYTPIMFGPTSTMFTKRGHLKNYEAMANDYNIGIMATADASNQSMGLEYNSTLKKFKFTYPNNPKVKVTITLPVNLSQDLGFGRVTKIEQDTESSPMEVPENVKDLEKTARTIVYDVGMATVFLVDNTNFQTIQFQNKVMGTLEPEYDGTMRMRCSTSDTPSILMSYFQKPELHFGITRYTENSEPAPIMLPTGAYIQGRLVGKSIKGDVRH